MIMVRLLEWILVKIINGEDTEEGYYEGYAEQQQQQEQHSEGIKYNKDYMKMVEKIAQMPYRKPAAGYDEVPTCIICHERPARDVFLPCEHTCVCKSCIESYGIKARGENG